MEEHIRATAFRVLFERLLLALGCPGNYTNCRPNAELQGWTTMYSICGFIYLFTILIARNSFAGGLKKIQDGFFQQACLRWLQYR